MTLEIVAFMIAAQLAGDVDPRPSSPRGPSECGDARECEQLRGAENRRGKNRPTPSTVRTTPSGAAVFLDGKMMGRSPWQGSISEGSHQLKLEKSGYQTQAELITAPADIEVRLVSLPMGFRLVVDQIAPGLEVKVDGLAATLEGDLYLATPGTHTVELLAPGFKPARASVKVSRTKPVALSIKLTKAPSVPLQVLRIVTTPPGARVSINDAPSGVTPFEGPFAPGEYVVALDLVGYEPLRIVHMVEVGQQNERQLFLKPLLTTLSVESKPQGALVFIDGEAKGPAPVMVSLEPGSHRVALTLEGYVPVDEAREVNPGNQIWEFALPPVRAEPSAPTPAEPPALAVDPLTSNELRHAQDVLRDDKANDVAKQKAIEALASHQKDLTKVIADVKPEAARQKLCLDYKHRVSGKTIVVTAFDSFRDSTPATVLINGQELGATPFDGVVPACVTRVSVKSNATGAVLEQDLPDINTREKDSLTFTFRGRSPRSVVSAFGDLALLPSGSGLGTQPHFGGGIRFDYWAKVFHFSVAAKASTLFGDVIGSSIVPAVDLFFGWGTAFGSDAVRFRFAFDVGAWTLVCASTRVSLALAINELLFVSVAAGLHMEPRVLLSGQPGFLFGSGTVGLGVGW